MKTPKRTIDFYNYYDPSVYEVDGRHSDFVCQRNEEIVHYLCARWKRKNKIAQLKRTIRRLSEEREHLKKVLAIRIVDDVVQADREALEYAQKHLSVERRMPEISRDNESGILLCAIKRPLVTWDGKEIIIQKP